MRKRQRTWRPRRDWGRAFALVLCVLFGIVGAVPLGLGFLVRTAPVRAWAARETSAIVAGKLEVSARYDVAVQAWPVVVALENVVVDASDGGEPFLAVERVAVRPRPFSLLGGHLDAGDVEIVGPRIRAVVEHGKLKNLKYKEPESDGGGRSQAPFASLAITDAHIDAWVDGVTASTRELDVDVSVEAEGAYEIALRAGQTALTRVHPLLGRPGEDAVDDDVICRAEARVRVQGGGRSLLVRRLALAGSADFDPDPGTRPSCSLRETDWRAVEVRLGALRVELPREQPIRVTGRVHAKLPAALAHRFKDLAPLSGSIIADLEVDYDGGAPLPQVSGHVATEMVGIDGKVFGKRVDLDLGVGGSAVRVSRLVAQWADGKVSIPEVTIEPFAKGVPISTGAISVEGVELPGLLRDLGAHPSAHVAWTLETGHFDFLKGHLDPPLIEGPLTVQTKNFEIFDRPAVDPLRAHMMGVREGTVRCNFVVNGLPRSAYKFPGIVVSRASIVTPRSHLDATVTLGFDTVIDIDVREGTRVDLAELSPLGTIPIAGVVALRAAGRGPFEHPKLVGELKITDFVFAGLPVGEVESPRVAFEPLVLDLFEARLRHGQSRARAPQVRLAFDAGAAVVADADIDSREAPGLRVRDLFEVFRFDKDPRWADVDAVLSGKARVHYVLGGREDHCGGGLLSVRTSMDLAAVSLLGERFDRGTMDADLLWDDQLAGTAGMRVDLRSATLRKGEGSVLVGASLRKGGLIRLNAVGSGIPLSRLDAFGAFARSLDGTATLVAGVSGTLSALEVGADVNVSRVRIGPATLGPSQLHVAMAPSTMGETPKPPAQPVTPVTPRPGKQCGNPRGGAFDPAEWEKDPSDGDIKLDGALFDGQLSLKNLRISRQRRKVIRGQVAARALDLGTLANLVPGVAFNGAPPKGSLSGTLDIKTLPLASPQRAEVSLALEALDLQRDGVSARLLGPTRRVELSGDQLSVDEFKVQLRSASGLTATVVAGGAVHHAVTAPDLDLHVRAEPVDLARLSADVPSVDRAAGQFSGSLAVAGPLGSLRYSGSAELRKGELALKGVPVSLSDVTVDVDITGSDVRLTKAFARVGGGTVQVTGRLPLRGPEAGSFLSSVVARGVKVPIADGINVTADAQLEASYRPAADAERGRRAVPEVKGPVELHPGQLHPPHHPQPEPARARQAHQRRQLRSGERRGPLQRQRGLAPPPPGDQQPGRHGARGDEPRPGALRHQPAFRGARALAHHPRLQGPADQQRVPGARGVRALRRSAADRAQARGGRPDRVPPLHLQRRPHRRQRGRLAGIERRRRRLLAHQRRGQHQLRRHLADHAPRPGRDRQPPGHPQQRSAPLPGGSGPPPHHRHDPLRDRLQQRPRRDRGPPGPVHAHRRRQGGQEHRPAHRRLPLRHRLLVAHRPLRAHGHGGQAHHRSRPRQRHHRRERGPRGPIQHRVAPQPPDERAGLVRQPQRRLQLSRRQLGRRPALAHRVRVGNLARRPRAVAPRAREDLRRRRRARPVPLRLRADPGADRRRHGRDVHHGRRHRGSSGPAQGSNCGTDPDTSAVLCLGSNVCPGLAIDSSAFPGCGFRVSGDIVDIECSCSGFLCPLPAASCADAATKLTDANYGVVCSQLSNGTCAEGTPAASSSSSSSAGGTCDPTCRSECGGAPACIQGLRLLRGSRTALGRFAGRSVRLFGGELRHQIGRLVAGDVEGVGGFEDQLPLRGADDAVGGGELDGQRQRRLAGPRIGEAPLDRGEPGGAPLGEGLPLDADDEVGERLARERPVGERLDALEEVGALLFAEVAVGEGGEEHHLDDGLELRGLEVTDGGRMVRGRVHPLPVHRPRSGEKPSERSLNPKQGSCWGRCEPFDGKLALLPRRPHPLPPSPRPGPSLPEGKVPKMPGRREGGAEAEAARRDTSARAPSRASRRNGRERSATTPSPRRCEPGPPRRSASAPR